MSKHDDYYYIPSGIDSKVASVILDQLNGTSLNTGLVNNGDLNSRNSKVGWISTDHWISGMLSHFIYSANNMYYQYELSSWADKIQYTVYDGEKTGYSWHVDVERSNFEVGHTRKLSISLCLSSQDEYEGGEFQVMINGLMNSKKMNCGDVIVFPSDAMHRVRPLKSGKRISLVGWMGGPNFK